MDKTTSISLGGYAFILDNSAFYNLKTYLDSIRNSLQGTEGVDEIVDDVETRIAELLRQRIKDREVVSERDIEGIIEQMGKPEDYVSEETDKAFVNDGTNKTSGNKSFFYGKKLFRDSSEAWIGGVCSGIAKLLEIEAIWVRLIFAAVAFLDIFTLVGISTSFVIICYIVLWAIVPEAVSTTDKLQMRGRPVNFDSIKEFAESTAENVNKAANDISPKAGGIIHLLAKVLLIVLGIYLIINGFGLIIGGLAGFFVFASGIIPPSHYLELTTGMGPIMYVGFALAALAIIIPGILLIILAFRVLSDRYRTKAPYVWGLVGLWLVSVLGAGMIAVSKSSKFWYDGATKEIVNLKIPNDTLSISFNKFIKQDVNRSGRWIENNDDLFKIDNQIIHRNVNWTVYPTTNSVASLEIEYEAQGSSIEMARENSKLATYNYELEGNRLILDDYLSLKKGENFSVQEIRLYLYIPKDMVIYSENMDRISFGREGEDWWRGGTKRDARENYYKFIEDELKCLSCEDENLADEDMEADSNQAQVEISADKGIQIVDGEDKIVINKDSIYIKDDTDTVRVNINGN